MINHRTQNHGMRFSRKDYATLQKLAKKAGYKSVSRFVNDLCGEYADNQGYPWEGLLDRGENQFTIPQLADPQE